jgi:uncharacterized protein (TIGR00730 family)
MPSQDKAYKNLDFLNSPPARHIRILCEYEEPRQRFRKHNVQDTIVFFGSARAKPLDEAKDAVAHFEREKARATEDEAISRIDRELRQARRVENLSRYYDETRELARRVTEWDMQRANRRRYYVSTGGGPGIMEAANRGAADVEGGRSVGLGISLPFEENLNPYVTPELAFEFHYFFTRKYWFLYLAKAMVLCPGGFGTMDEFFETLTLRQTGKIKRPLPTVLFGRSYWDEVMDLQKMVEWGTISESDLSLFHPTDSIDDAFDFLVSELEALERAEVAPEGE